MKLFSIIIPTYNYAHVLPNALDSALSQPGDEYEVIVIDDGSTDTTKTTIETYLSKHPSDKLKYFYQDNQGAAAARNHGVSISQGQFLIFLDADDQLCDQVLPKIKTFLQSHSDTEFLIAEHITHLENGTTRHKPIKPLPSSKAQRFKFYLNKQISIVNGATTIKRTVFNTLHYPEQFRNSEDLPFFAQCLALFNASTLPIPMANIYKHPNSLRNQSQFAEAIDVSIVDAVFDNQQLPAECLKLKPWFVARRLLSLFRTFLLAKDYSKAKTYYHRALRANAFLALQPKYLGKYIRMRFKRASQ